MDKNLYRLVLQLRNESGGIGIGIYIELPDGKIETISEPSGTRCTSTNSEIMIMALETAAKYVKEKLTTKTVILTDAKSILEELKSPKNNDMDNLIDYIEKPETHDPLDISVATSSLWNLRK